MGKLLIQQGDTLSTTNKHHLILYDAPASPCARRCRISLIEKGLDWDTVNINIPLMEQRSAGYLAINPNGFVPTLAHGNKVIIESSVINTYLEDQFPDVPLMPSNAKGIAKVRMWQASELAMAKVYRPVMYSLSGGLIKRISRTEEEAETIAKKATTDPYDLAWEKKVWKLEVLSQDDIKQHLVWLQNWVAPIEKALEDKDFLVDNAFSQADIAIFPRLKMFENIGLDITSDRYPNVGRWMDALSKRESITQSEPEEARKLAALNRSDMMLELRSYYAKPTHLRTPEEDESIRAFGKKFREIAHVDELLSSNKKPRSLPMPSKRYLVEPKPHSAAKSQRPYNLTLYGSELSTHSYRVELLLQHLQLNYEYVEVDITAGQQRTPEFLAMNPLGEVPVLLADDLVVFDSAAIAEYLCSCVPESNSLQATNSINLANQNTWLALEAGTHKEFEPLLQESQMGKSGSMNKDQCSLLVTRAMDKVQLLEQTLKKSPFLTGDNISFADIAWYSRIVFMSKTALGERISALKSVQRWAAHVDSILSTSSAQLEAKKPV